MLVLELVSDVSQGRIMNPWLVCLQSNTILEPVLEPPDLCMLVSRTHYYNIVSEVNTRETDKNNALGSYAAFSNLHLCRILLQTDNRTLTKKLLSGAGSKFLRPGAGYRMGWISSATESPGT